MVLQESGNVELRPLAYQRLLRLVQLDPGNERVYFNLGMIAMDDQDYKGAERWFRKVCKIFFPIFNFKFFKKQIYFIYKYFFDFKWAGCL